MRSLPPPFSSSDFSEPLIQSNTFTSLSPGSGSFTQTRRDNTVIQMTPLASESRRRSELPDLPRQSRTLRGVSTQRLLRAVQDLTGCSWLSPPSRCGSRELPQASFPKAKGTGTAVAHSSLESTAHCGQSSRWDPPPGGTPKDFPIYQAPLRETLFLLPLQTQSGGPGGCPAASLDQLSPQELEGSLGEYLETGWGSGADVKPFSRARLSKQGPGLPLPTPPAPHINRPGGRQGAGSDKAGLGAVLRRGGRGSGEKRGISRVPQGGQKCPHPQAMGGMPANPRLPPTKEGGLKEGA